MSFTVGSHREIDFDIVLAVSIFALTIASLIPPIFYFMELNPSGLLWTVAKLEVLFYPFLCICLALNIKSHTQLSEILLSIFEPLMFLWVTYFSLISVPTFIGQGFALVSLYVFDRVRPASSANSRIKRHVIPMFAVYLLFLAISYAVASNS